MFSSTVLKISKIIEGQLGFTLFEGGRKVAQGMLRS
jgi:hypothetical protein